MIYEDENMSFYWHDGVLMCDWKFIHADYNIVDFGVKKRLEITGDKPCVMISDIRSLKTSTKQARTRMSDKDAQWGMLAVGVVVNSWTQSIVFNFFQEIYHPKATVKLFIDKEKAIEWCKGFLSNPK